MSNYSSVLIFKGYKVNEIIFKNNDIFKKEKNSFPLDIKIKSSLENNKNEMKVNLITEIYKNAEENNYPFSMTVNITGIFESEDGKADIFYKNAIAIMYPYVRAIVSSYTALANVNPLILPPINVNKLIEEQEKKDDII